MEGVKKEEPRSFIEKLHLNYVTPIIAILLSIYTFYDTVRAGEFKKSKDKIDSTTRILDNIKTETDIKINELSFKQELKFKLYGEVKEALYKKNEENDKLVTLMVYSMLDTSEIDFQNNLIALLSTKKSEAIDTIINRNVDFNNETKKIIAINPNMVKIDVFYLDDIIEESEERAKLIVNLLKNKYKDYTVRLRLLPKTVNIQSGYRIDSNQIRYEKGTDEEKLSKEIIELIKAEKIFKKEQLSLRNVRNKTSNYISIFVRNM